MFKAGTPVIYRVNKVSSRPGPRALAIHPAPRGETYGYCVDKLWIVEETRDDNTVVLRTRRGKLHILDATDPNLRQASWWERIKYHDRFPQPEKAESPDA